MSEHFTLPAASLDRLFGALAARGYTCVGPTVRDGAIVYDELTRADDLPRGWTDRQAPGEYRLERRDDDAFFGYVVGPHSWKQFLFPPEQRLWRMRRTADGGMERVDAPGAPPRYAFIGVRACELAALGIQDRVFTHGAFTDETYRGTRAGAFVVGVSCTQSASTCFCASVGTGPAVRGDCDLALVEVLGDEHVFLVTAHTDEGREVLDELALAAAPTSLEEQAEAAVDAAAEQQRTLDTDGLPELLHGAHDSPRWDEIATRCTSCANCTLVCPTCFCSDIEDVSDLTGEHAERWRRWDSCFNAGFSAIHGGEVRRSISSRYRQWLTHKLGTWVEQFGSSGCVGCGRCITWCPVGIDLTEEIARMQEDAT